MLVFLCFFLINIIATHAHRKTFSFWLRGKRLIGRMSRFHNFIIIQRKNKMRFSFIWQSHLKIWCHFLKEKHFFKIHFRIMRKHHILFCIFVLFWFFLFCFCQKCESWFSDGTAHSLGDEQDAALHSHPVLPYSKPFSTGFQEVLQVQWGNSSRTCC